IADVQPPDYETRIAILRKKAERDHITVPDDVMAYIAKNIASNIRELEGALTRIVAFATLTNQDISISLAENSLKDIFSENASTPLTPDLIQQVVAEHYNIRVEDIQGSKKPKNIAFPRQVSMYLCRKMLDISLPKIGESFGGRDHTTVIHAITKIEKQLETDTALQKTILQLEKEIKEA
ncbi:MAG: chromosomal replication initiator protein DnaA, partial [Anaerotignum sp.]|nr:chromosomal replication initiator protein DnaA [Anaerotignum sp.]